jgi:hypothetical protein
MLYEKTELSRITNRLELMEATRKYDSDRYDEFVYEHRGLGQKIRTLNERIIELEKEVHALREALSIREAGPQGIVPIGPESEMSSDDLTDCLKDAAELTQAQKDARAFL